ncbi:MAG: GNAT family N-acetyltransferase [Actinomycetota bacterium]
MEDHKTGREVDDFVERLSFTAVLNDGTPVRIRPIAPKDKQRLAEGWKQLSPKSRYLRFLQAKSELSGPELAYLTEIDYSDHFAWAAETLDEPDPPGIGVARYIRDPNDPAVAEAAIAVVDQHQRKGLGRILLQALADAALENGIDRFRSYVASSNRQVLESLTKLGATPAHAEDGAISLELPLPIEALDKSALYAALRAVAIDQTLRAQTPDNP